MRSECIWDKIDFENPLYVLFNECHLQLTIKSHNVFLVTEILIEYHLFTKISLKLHLVEQKFD